jgi:hypothetical protein
MADRFAAVKKSGQERVKPAKKAKCAAIMIVFRQNRDVVLSYQGSRRPRIVDRSGMPVCGDWQFVINF